jgi:hypothetical protein
LKYRNGHEVVTTLPFNSYRNSSQHTFLVDDNQNLRHWLDQNGTFNVESLKSITTVLQDFKGHHFLVLGARAISAQCYRPAEAETQSTLVGQEAL